MDTILVTGGAGFIGCNFVRLALAETDGACRRPRQADLRREPGEPEEVLGDPAPELRPRRRRRPRRRAAGLPGAPAERGGQLRGREPRRPLDRRRLATSCAPTWWAPSSCSTRPASTSPPPPRPSASASASSTSPPTRSTAPWGPPAPSRKRRPTPPTPPTPPPRPGPTTWCAPTTRPTACRLCSPTARTTTAPTSSPRS